MDVLQHVKSINEFSLVDAIGNGASSDVWLATHHESGIQCAIKRISRASIRFERQVENVFEEKKNLMKFHDCDWVVDLYATIQDDEYLYFVLQWMNGGDLEAQVTHFSSFNENTLKFYLKQIVVAVGCVHNRGILHRDLKLTNILVTKRGRIRVCDWAFARPYGDSVSRRSKVGTPHCMCPEMLDGNEQTVAVDWWCVGVMMYWMMVGRVPFRHPNALEEANLIRTKELPPLPNHFSKDCIDFCQRLLVKNPMNRLGSDGDCDEVKAHSWFNGVDWSNVIPNDPPPQFMSVHESTDQAPPTDDPFVDF